MHTNTLFRILSAYHKTGRTVGLSPWDITLSIRAVSEISGVSRNTAAAAITAANGFIQTDDGWKIGKAFKWAELKAHYDNRTPRGALKAWWDALPEYKGTAGNNEGGLSADEKELIEKFRKSSKLAQENTLRMMESAESRSHTWEKGAEEIIGVDLMDNLDFFLQQEESEERYIRILKWALMVSVTKIKLMRG